MKIKVTNIRYFDTRRGVGYECETNVKGLSIWNDGDGGSTYFESDRINLKGRDIGLLERIFDEDDLEKMIDQYESKHDDVINGLNNELLRY